MEQKLGRLWRRIALALSASIIALPCAFAHAQSVSYRHATVDGIKIFYREAGDPGLPAVVLLHGIPSSSQMFRGLIPLLAGHFHVIAPDFVGMGNSDAPPASTFVATQENLTTVMERFLRETVRGPVILYMQDLGGPIGMRIASRHPDWISGLIFQNTPISMAGWNPERVKPLLGHTGPVTEEERSVQERRDLRAADVYLYRTGTRDLNAVDPDAMAIDAAALSDPDKKRIMADYLADARLSFDLYPRWQAYLRKYQPRTLVVWGERDPIFDAAGVKDIQAAVPAARVHLYDTGHFALQEDAGDIARQIIDAFAR